VGNNELFRHYTLPVTFEGVQDGNIIELAFISDKPVFVKYRNDKPAPNSSAVAEDVWLSIKHSLDEDVIRGKNFGVIYSYHNRLRKYLYCTARTGTKLLCLGSDNFRDIDDYITSGYTDIYFLDREKKKLSLGNMRHENIDFTILDSLSGHKFDNITCMLDLTLYFDKKDSILSLVKLVKDSLNVGGCFMALSIDGNKVSSMMNKSGYFQKTRLNLKQIEMNVIDKIITVDKEGFLSGKKGYVADLHYLHDVFLANGFKKIEYSDAGNDMGLNSEELVFNSLFTYMIFKKLEN
jgi:hypothetical protein